MALKGRCRGGSKSRTNRGAGWRTIEWRLVRDTGDGARRGAIDWAGDVCRMFSEGGRGRGEGGLMGKGSAVQMQVLSAFGITVSQIGSVGRD